MVGDEGGRGGWGREGLQRLHTNDERRGVPLSSGNRYINRMEVVRKTYSDGGFSLRLSKRQSTPTTVLLRTTLQTRTITQTTTLTLVYKHKYSTR